MNDPAAALDEGLVEALATDTKDIVAESGALQIDDTATAEAASALMHDIKGMKEEVKKTFDPVCDTAHRAWKAAVAARSKHLEPLEQAETVLRRKMSVFQLRLEEERQAEIREAQAKAVAEAEKAAAADPVAAFEPPAPVVVAAPPPAPKISGISTRKDWDFEVQDITKLPAQYLLADEKKIRKVVQALGDQANIAGVRVFQKVVTIVR